MLECMTFISEFSTLSVLYTSFTPLTTAHAFCFWYKYIVNITYSVVYYTSLNEKSLCNCSLNDITT